MVSGRPITVIRSWCSQSAHLAGGPISMFPSPGADLAPNTADFERLPLVKPTGFREYDDVGAAGGWRAGARYRLGALADGLLRPIRARRRGRARTHPLLENRPLLHEAPHLT